MLINGASTNTIGGFNTIGSNTTAGVEISGSGATGNIVSGSFIGTDSTATQQIGNGVGVLISGVSGNSVSGSNIIDFNATGVQITASATMNTVSGNTIAGNTASGVLIDASSSGNTVGGATSADGNTITGDVIGVLINGASTNTIGGFNTIVLNTAAGVQINGSRATGNVVSGSFIGTDPAATPNLGNGDGVLIAGTSSGNIVGGTIVAAANVVAMNVVGVNVDSGTGNAIRQNSIYANTQQAILLNTANNANNSQAAPTLKIAATSGNKVKILAARPCLFHGRRDLSPSISSPTRPAIRPGPGRRTSTWAAPR